MERAAHVPLTNSNQSGEARRVKSALPHVSSSPAVSAGPERDDSEDDVSNVDEEDGDSYSSAHAKDDDSDRESLGEQSQREATEVEDDLPSDSFEEAHELRARHDQLQDDVEVLAAHLEAQTLEREKERAAMRLQQNQLQHANLEMARELHSFRIENDALRRQNALLQRERDEFQQKATVATETQEELLLALKKQQQSEEQLQNANVLIVRERAQIRKALEATQNHCRRLEEELAALQTHMMQLQSERAALQAAAAAINSTQHTHEAEQIRLQDEMIGSLRADLLQMEFEYKTLALDRETLNEKLTKAQKRLCGDSDAYDVIPLGKAAQGGSKPLSSKQLKQLEKEQAKREKLRLEQQQQRKKLNIRPIRNHYESENGGFSGVMELPNSIADHPQRSSSSSSSCSLTGDATCTTAAAAAAMAPPPLRRSSSFSKLVSKTVSSAKKKLFAPSQNKIVLPQ